MNEEEEGFNVSRWAQHAEDEKEEEEEGLFKANAVNEEDGEKERGEITGSGEECVRQRTGSGRRQGGGMNGERGRERRGRDGRHTRDIY